MKFTDYLIHWDDAPMGWTPTWIIDKVWQHEGVNFLAGPPKRARKSSLRRYFTACAIAGAPAFGQFPVGKRAKKVLSMIIEDHPGTEKAMIDAALKALGHTAKPNIIFTSPLGFHLNNPLHLASLVSYVKNAGVDLVTLDPLVEFHGADENSASEMARVAVALREVAQYACVAVTHHTPKPQQGGLGFRTVGESMRGSTVLAGSANATIKVSPKSGGRVMLSFETKLCLEPNDIEVTCDEISNIWSKAIPLTDALVLETVQKNPGVTRDDIQKRLGYRRQDIRELVKSLIDNGLVKETKSAYKTPGQLWAVQSVPGSP